MARELISRATLLVFRGAPSARFHKRTVLSELPLTSNLPSGLMARQVTSSLWPFNTARRRANESNSVSVHLLASLANSSYSARAASPSGTHPVALSRCNRRALHRAAASCASRHISAHRPLPLSTSSVTSHSLSVTSPNCSPWRLLTTSTHSTRPAPRARSPIL